MYMKKSYVPTNIGFSRLDCTRNKIDQTLQISFKHVIFIKTIHNQQV